MSLTDRGVDFLEINLFKLLKFIVKIMGMCFALIN